MSGESCWFDEREAAAVDEMLDELPGGNGRQSSPIVTAVSGGWERPRELPPEGIHAPPMESHLIPPCLRDWATDTAERMQMPADFIVVPAIVAAGALLAGKMSVAPKQHDDWIETPNLFGAAVGKPGVGKTPCETEGLSPHARLEQAAYVAWKQLCETLPEGEDPPRRDRFRIGDATIEKLGEIIAAQPHRVLLQYRAELSGWLRSFERSGREMDRAFWLEAWDGKNPFTTDRVGRGTIHIPRLAMAVYGGIQPGVLREYVAQAKGHGGGADGLLQRFGLLVWPEIPREWRNVDRRPDFSARHRVFKAFERLERLTPESVGAIRIEDRDIPALRFTLDAQELVDTWRGRLMDRLRSDQHSDAFGSHLSKFRRVMPCLALIFHLLEYDSGPIGLDAARLAAAWTDHYLEPHARKVYDEPAPGLVEAHALAERVLAGDVRDGMRVRDVYRSGWAKLPDREAVRRGLAVLEQHDWLRVSTVGEGIKRGDIVELNPEVTRG